MARLEVPVQLRWSDMDAYAHVNNVEMLRLLEEARIEAFWSHPVDADGTRPDGGWSTAVLDAGPTSGMSTLIARQEIEYLLPLGYQRRPVVVEMWIGRLGGASLEVCYEVRDRPAAEDGSAVYARATTTIVLVDTTTGQPQRIGPAERAAWAPFVEEPVTFRRRR